MRKKIQAIINLLWSAIEENPWLELLVVILRYFLVNMFINGIAGLMRLISQKIYQFYSKYYDTVSKYKICDRRTGSVALFFASGSTKVIVPLEITDDAEYAKEVELFTKSSNAYNIHDTCANDDGTTTIIYVDGRVVRIRFRNVDGK